MRGRLTSAFWLMLLVFGNACSPEESNREQMVNLKVIKDDPEAQLANLNNAIERSKKDGSLYGRRAMVLLRKGELEKALADANQAVQLSRDNPANLFVKAQVLRAMQKPEQALPLALQAERNSYQSSSLYVLLSELYLQKQDFEQAREYVRKALQLSPADEYAFYYQGRIAAASGDTAQAIKSYKFAIEHAPEFMEPKRELAGVLLHHHDYERALPYVEAARQLAPRDGQILYFKGVLAQVAQKTDSAFQLFSQAVAVSDTLQQAHYRMGLILYGRGDNEGAIEHLVKAAGAFRNLPRYMAVLASAYERTGQSLMALEQYQRLVALDPTYTYAYQRISYLKYRLQRPVVVKDTTEF
ncbi:tetratricopeptide repeat protein [Pontibacter ruber]|uniref:tetratricopeptide repeat protein n=1 Tax=Pontibacter ruber TaxID=1343895 RepID=UPI00202851CD|nr:tetratricopeptide repeat protein [Pontibacter ruber]